DLPTTMPPRSSSSSTITSEKEAIWSLNIGEPSVKRTSFTGVRSLMASGKPCRCGPSRSSGRSFASASAWARARSKQRVGRALIAPSVSRMRRSDASRSSAGETFRAFRSAMASCAVSLIRSSISPPLNSPPQKAFFAPASAGIILAGAEVIVRNIMTERMFDTTCIGNAIVDVISKADDAFLAAEGLTKSAMMLIDMDRAEELYAKMEPGIEMSGGSAGNTAAGIASLGGRCAYVGKVRDDQLGDIFTHDIRASGVTFETPALTHGAATARCLILVTPDAHRTMNTYLGACVELGPEDIDPEIIRASKVTYMEGYLWDPENGKQAFRKAAE